MITISAFRWVPPFAQGQVRDLRVRWALEEAGRTYEEWLLGQVDQNSPDYRALQPFGQVPGAEIDGCKMFESGAIVQRIAEESEALMPRDPDGRWRTITWMFAALNTVEPPIMALATLFFYKGEAWTENARPAYVAAVAQRLDVLEGRLTGCDHLEDRFTAADLLMTTVLRILDDTDLVTKRPKLAAYKKRCEDRPAFARALAAQMRPFKEAEAARARQ